MAYTTIDDPKLYFQTVLYTGNQKHTSYHFRWFCGYAT